MMGSKSLALCIGLLAISGAATARPFDQLWVFGDSTVDTGWYRKPPYSGNSNYDYYIKMPGADVGRPTSSPGPMSVQVLAHAISLATGPENQGSTDYATGGARDYLTNNAASGFFPHAVPTRTQLVEYMNAHDHLPLQRIQATRNLYVVSSGGNDVAFAIKTFTSTSDAIKYLTRAAHTLAAAIKELSVGPVGIAPVHIIVVGLPESFGDAEAQQYRHVHDDMLQARLHALHVPYAWADLNGVRKLMEQPGPSPFGLSYFGTTSPACPKPLPNSNSTVTTDWAYVCSSSSAAATHPANADASEFADDAHWATGAQAVLGSYMYCLAQKTWPAQGWPTTNPHLPFACSNFATLL